MPMPMSIIMRLQIAPVANRELVVVTIGTAGTYTP